MLSYGTKRPSPRLGPVLLAACAALAALVAAAPADAQEVRGRIADASFGDPQQSVTVELIREDSVRVRWTLTDEDGEYKLEAEPGVPFKIRASRLGFFTWDSEEFTLEPGEKREINISIRINPVQLEQLLVERRSSRVSSGRELVRRHQLAGKGVFLSGTIFAATDPHYTLDAFRQVEGIMVNGNELVAMRGPYRCLKFLHNNLPLRHEAGYNAILPQDIAAVEVYREFSEVPTDLRFEALDFNNETGEVRHCGLVNMWTKGAW